MADIDYKAQEAAFQKRRTRDLLRMSTAKSAPTRVRDIAKHSKMLKEMLDSRIQTAFQHREKSVSEGYQMPSKLDIVKREIRMIRHNAQNEFEESRALKGVLTTGKAQVVRANSTRDKEIAEAKGYIKSYGHLKRGTPETKKALDNGDNNQKDLWRFHKQDLERARETLKKYGIEDGSSKSKSKAQKTDAQAKTAKVPKGRNPGLKKIADKMKADGKVGWVTINGNRIFLG
jgi:hypothetical protein